MSGKGLSFLSKKSWHTGSIRHMEKVWKAEQVNSAEQKKIQELQRELQKERAKKEILDAVPEEIKAGKEKLDWMYRGVLVSTTTEQLNKPYVPAAEKEDFSVPSLLQKKQATLATHDDWSKLNEDPLLLIRQREQDSIKSITNNPIVMKKIAKQLKSLEKKEKHSHRATHKSAKKDKKEKREKKDKKERKEKKAHHLQDGESSGKHYPAQEIKQVLESRDYHSERRRSPSPRGSYRRRSRSPPSSRYSDRRRSPSPRGSYRRRSRSPPREAERRRSPPRSNYRRDSRSSNKLSEEEIKRRLEEMQDDGKSNYETKLTQYKQRREENKNSLEAPLPVSNDANFINDMKDQVYSGPDATVKDRLTRNRFFRQRGDLTEKGII